MKVGDLVRHWLTEQQGIIIKTTAIGIVRVHWTTQGISLYGAGSREWCDTRSLEVINEGG